MVQQVENVCSTSMGACIRILNIPATCQMWLHVPVPQHCGVGQADFKRLLTSQPSQNAKLPVQ